MAPPAHHTGTMRGRLPSRMRAPAYSAVLGVRDGALQHRHLHQVLLGIVDALWRWPPAPPWPCPGRAHHAVLVPHHHDGGEGEGAATLVTLVTRFRATSLSFSSRSLLLTFLMLASAMPDRVIRIEPSFAGGVGEGFHPAVVQVSVAVEDHRGDTGGLRLLGDAWPTMRACSVLATSLAFLSLRDDAEASVRPFSSSMMGIDALVAAIDREAGTLRVPCTFRRTRTSIFARRAFLSNAMACLIYRQPARLATDVLTDEAHRPCRVPACAAADLRRHLAHELLVGAFQADDGFFPSCWAVTSISSGRARVMLCE